MQTARYYRKQAALARRLSGLIFNQEEANKLLQMAEDFEDLVADLEGGAIEVCNPAAMPQLDHERS